MPYHLTVQYITNSFRTDYALKGTGVLGMDDFQLTSKLGR